MSQSLEPTLDQLQREIQRKLGRNILRLQQYEYLAKQLIVGHKVSGCSPEDVEHRLAGRHTKYSTQSLGPVIDELKKSYLATTSQDATNANFQGNGDEKDDAIVFGYLHQLQFSPERYAEVCTELEELRSLRNDLVHHFIERFEFGNAAGCQQAIAYLDSCYATIDERFTTLAGWAESANSTRRLAAAIDESPEFQNMLLHGILPNGQINWPLSTVVELLREAETLFRKEQGTLLKDAVTYISTRYPDETPAKYHCKRWRQVLHESGLFDIRKIRDERGEVLIWYRSK